MGALRAKPTSKEHNMARLSVNSSIVLGVQPYGGHELQRVTIVSCVVGGRVLTFGAVPPKSHEL
eukprot:5739219-Amphidinium_carterae.1